MSNEQKSVMNISAEKKTAGGPLDFTLLLSRMEGDIVKGSNEVAWRKILVRQDIWKRADVDKQRKWARVAQMAGDMETALRVFAHINHERRDLNEAWIERLELLLVLDRREEIAKVVAEAREHLGEKTCSAWLKLCGGPGSRASEAILSDVSSPFETLRRRQAAILHYLGLFSGREDCFARQWADKKEGKQGYVPVRRPMEPEDVEEHLSGRKTYGIYILRSDATVKTAVIDVDIIKKLRSGKVNAEERRQVLRERDYLLSRIRELAHEQGMEPVIEFSGGKGFHFWFLFESPIRAAEAKACLAGITGLLAGDVSCFSLEVFPKQAQLTGKGMGNLVKLPLGVHRVSGKRSHFIECHDRSTEAQLDFLMRLHLIKPAAITVPRQAQNEKKVLVHPRVKKWAEDWPELYRLETLCPPLGQIMASCRQGREISAREEKIVFQTIGFLPRGKSLLHHLMMSIPEYNPHLVDFNLSKLRGTPLGCRRIHSLLGFAGDICPFDVGEDYAHPLLHVGEWKDRGRPKSEKIVNLQSALENLKLAVSQVQRFMA
jgi:hypothetical protein